MRIERSDHGWWVHNDRGRGRFYPNGSSVAEKIERGLDAEAMAEAERTRRVFAEGTHEPVKAWRNPDGTIGIPPDPSFPCPDDAEPFEIRTLAQADAVCKEIREEMLGKWQGDQQFTEMADWAFGDPRKALLQRMAETSSNFERDTLRLLVEELDKEQSNRENVDAYSYFPWRES